MYAKLLKKKKNPRKHLTLRSMFLEIFDSHILLAYSQNILSLKLMMSNQELLLRVKGRDRALKSDTFPDEFACLWLSRGLLDV